MTDPILPEPEVHDAAGYRRAYTADQMRAYAAAARAQALEDAALHFEGTKNGGAADMMVQAIANELRAMKDKT